MHVNFTRLRHAPRAAVRSAVLLAIISAFALPVESLAQSPIGRPGVDSLYSTTDSASYVLTNRNNQVATGVRDSVVDQILYYDATDGLTSAPLPSGDAFLRLSFSDWGATVVTNRLGTGLGIFAGPYAQPVTKVYAAPRSGALSIPVINDAGAGSFAGRDVPTTQFINVYAFSPGGTPALLPSLGANSLSQYSLIDNEGRITVVAQPLPAPSESYLERYVPSSGWQTLSTPAGESVVTSQPAYATNASGDISFLTYEYATGNYYLNRYNDATSSSSRLADITIHTDAMINPRLTTVSMADNGALVALIGGSGYQDIHQSLLLWRPDGSRLDLGTLLPANQAIPDFPYSEQFYVAQNGNVLFDAKDTLTGLWSYYKYDYEHNKLVAIPQLAGVATPLVFSALSNDDKVYFWAKDGATSVFAMTTVPNVPEPATFVLAALGLVSLAFVRGRRRTAAASAQWTTAVGRKCSAVVLRF